MGSRGGDERAAALGELGRGRDLQRDAAGIGLVRDVRRQHLGGHGIAEGQGRRRGRGIEHQARRDRHAERLEERQRPPLVEHVAAALPAAKRLARASRSVSRSRGAAGSRQAR